MRHNKYSWERLNGHVEKEGWNVQIEQKRRKADECKLTAKGRNKGQKVARCQAVVDAMPEAFMQLAQKANRAERQRIERKAKRCRKF